MPFIDVDTRALQSMDRLVDLRTRPYASMIADVPIIIAVISTT
jgi:hypothetical protein